MSCTPTPTVNLCPTEHLPGPDANKQQMINYYQWVSLFILVQALLFLVPVMLWRHLCSDICVQIDGVVANLRDVSKNCAIDNRMNTIKAVVMRTDG